MKRSKSLGTVFAIGLIAAMTSCKRAPNEFVAPPPPEVTVATPLKKSVTPYLVYSGTTEAFETVDLRARVQGFLESVKFSPGQTVKKGDLLFVIEKDEFAARVAQAEASISSAKAALDLAAVTLQKYEIAFKEGGMTELEVKEKTAARDQAKAGLELAEAQLIRANLDLSYCDIHAPIDGRISKNLIDAGNLVGQGQASLLATIYASEPIFVTIDAPEDVVLQFRRRSEGLRESGSVQPGQNAQGEWRQVELSVADEKGFPHVGRVDYVDPTLDPNTGTLRVRVRFDNKGGFLLPGLFARIRVGGDPFDALLVPDECLLADQQGRFAYVVKADDTIDIRRVKTGPLEGDLRVVTDGLAASDRVVIIGLQRARFGLPVAPKAGEITPTPDTSTPAAGTAKEG